MRILIAALALFVANAAGDWEKFSDGSIGRVMSFQGAGGVTIASYVRTPNGTGSYPLVINLHGGGPSAQATYSYGRSKGGLVAQFIAAGWAVYSLDFRTEPRSAPLDPVEYEDTMAGIAAARRLPFVDGERIALTGGSHGGHVMNRMASRVSARCALLYSPTWIDTAQMKKGVAEEKNTAVVERLNLLISFAGQLKGAAREAFDKASALGEAPQVRCPLLIIDGGTDVSLPLWMVREYEARLRTSGKVVETYLPAVGDHGFYGAGTTPESKEAQQRTMAFFKKYLK
jgi:dipeptidyl aminopeptidase/acylaminoacyl peptidase